MSKFLHTMIRVGNLDRSVKFYTDLLGMQELRRRGSRAARACADEHRAGPRAGPAGAARRGAAAAARAGIVSIGQAS